MSQDNIKNEYEILLVPKELKLVRRIRPICLGKAKDICKFLSFQTNKPVFWYNNTDDDELEIYTEGENLEKAIKLLDDFEHDYKSTLRKREMIIKHRHKKD